MTEDISKKRALVYDSSGLFVSLALRLAKDFEEVAYFVPWESSFPDGKERVIGSGLPGINRLKYFDSEYEKYNLLIFSDVFGGDLQEDLRRRGHRVWGAGWGSELELSRWKTRQRYKQIGLDENECAMVHGTKALREYLQEHPRQYVKLSTFRGLGETWLAENAVLAEGPIREIEAKHGAMADILDFIVEVEIPDAREIGFDGFAIGGEFPGVSMMGVEKKDRAYFGKTVKYDELPEGVRKVNDALSGPLSEFNYRQFLSTEIREKGGKNFLIDLTCRCASPAGEVFCENCSNLAEVMYYGAAGQIVQPVFQKKFGAQIILTSEWAETNWMPVQFDESLRPFLKLYNWCRIEGVDYVVPQIAAMKQIGSVVALGNTPQEAIKICKERAQSVRGFDLDMDLDALDKAAEEMDADK